MFFIERSRHIAGGAERHDPAALLSHDALEAIAFDPYTHGYYRVGGRVGNAFKDGLGLK